MKYLLCTLLYLLCSAAALQAQSDSITRQDEIYNRPFITTIGESATAIGGYVEGNTNYFSEDGVSEGFSMELRRFNIFLYSAIGPRIRFLSELEFEHGTEEIALETAQVDFEFHSALVLRGGVILAPIGNYNINHDSPKWDFIERPLVATEIIPSTLSEIGFGLNGKVALSGAFVTYDAYVVNGLQADVILNEEGRTFLQSGKSEELLAEDNNGEPAFTGKLAFKYRKYGELGLSAYHGAYNNFKAEGEEVEEKRNLTIAALDFSTQIEKATIRGEVAIVALDVPDDIVEIYGDSQWGGYVEITYPVIRSTIAGFTDASINAGVRLERIDYNVGDFAATGANIGDEVDALAVSLSFRPNASTVIRANYRHHWITDILENPTVKSAGFQFGIASYF